MKPFLVSIIVPCYNVEDYISDCLDSAISQTYRPIEIIAIDNNSIDNTFSILKEYEVNYPRLIKVIREKKQGASATRNKGLSVASGKWIQFLDADDIIYPNKIKSQIELVKDNKQIIVVIGIYQHEKKDGTKQESVPLEKSTQ